MRAYVFVRVATGHEREVLEALQSVTSVEEIHFLFGDWDYILSIHAPDTQSLSRLIGQRIRSLPGVLRTMTLLEAPG